MRRKAAKFIENLAGKNMAYFDFDFEDFSIRFDPKYRNFRNVQIEINYEIEEEKK